mmetsp:Transcript_21742/g.47412  ORF Transcript_21742/g.47412 Transcript_21742/m.47412 type:complete len:118 (+) Transcript_21742:188-541(+)
MTASTAPNDTAAVKTAEDDNSLICGCFDSSLCSPFSTSNDTEVTRDIPTKTDSPDDLTETSSTIEPDEKPAESSATDASVGSKKRRKSRSLRLRRKVRNSIAKKNSIRTEVKRLKCW